MKIGSLNIKTIDTKYGQCILNPLSNNVFIMKNQIITDINTELLVFGECIIERVIK